MQNKSEKISRHCGRGPAIQGFYKEKTTLLNRLDPGYPAGRPSGMTTKSAFTLIELLVVVLIIGILAAVAVPQYNLAVAKSRVNGLLPIGKSVAQAEEVYYLENAKYTENWDELSVNVPGEKDKTNYMNFANGRITVGNMGVSVHPYKVGGARIYFFYKNISHSFAGKQSCYASMNNDFANKICQLLTNKKTPSSNNGPDTDNIYHFNK